MMRGFVPNVRTVGIITAENPNSVQADPQFNAEANAKLEKQLRTMNLGFQKIRGKYGNTENPFFVPNITKDELLQLGRECQQTSVIYGEKTGNTRDGKTYDGMVFQMIFTDHRFGQVDSERKIFVNVQDRQDYYSEIKGRKFVIPFYDDEFAGAEFGPRTGVVQGKTLPESVVTEANWSVDKSLAPATTPMGRWVERGHIKKLLQQT